MQLQYESNTSPHAYGERLGEGMLLRNKLIIMRLSECRAMLA